MKKVAEKNDTELHIKIPRKLYDALYEITIKRTAQKRKETNNPNAKVTLASVCREFLRAGLNSTPPL